MRHETLLKKNPRMALQLKNLARLDGPAREAIQTQAQAHINAHAKGNASPQNHAEL